LSGTEKSCLGRFYIILAFYHHGNKHDIPTAINFCETAISLAASTGNTQRHSEALCYLARIKWCLGDFPSARVHACDAQRLARISGNLFREALALRIEAMYGSQLGDYKQSLSLCNRARNLLGLCGMSGGRSDHSIMASQAEIHRLKSEYNEAHNVLTQILQEAFVDQDKYTHAFALLNLAEIGLSIGAPKDALQRNIERARKIFQTTKLDVQMTMCDVILADLYLREGDILEAKTLFENCLTSFQQPEIKFYCLERLGDVSLWDAPNSMSRWTTLFLVHSLNSKERLGIYKSLQFLGHFFLAQNDGDTAISLFTVAQDGFTQMDVHRSRAECMLRLGDLSKRNGNPLKAVELWETARPLFERSSQTKRVQNIDERLASFSDDVLEQHRKNLACLAKFNAPSESVDLKNSVTDIEDIEEDLDGAEEV
jgi:tetratricopeptide (TPR) repeat protein